MTTFTCSGTSTSIALDPVRPLSLPRSGAVVDGLDSSGTRYTYTRSVRYRSLNLTFAVVTSAELTALRDFLHNNVTGARNLFTWTDQDAQAHTVRYHDLSWTRTAPNCYRVTLALDELL